MAVVKKDQLYMQLNAAELEAIIKKDSPSSNDRDAGFCSASSESEGGDDLALENVHTGSPGMGHTKDYGALAVEEKSIVLVRNKRKSMEPSKVVESTSLSEKYSPRSTANSYMVATSGPLKKRIRYTSSADSAVMLTPPSIPSPPHSHVPPSALEHAWDSSHASSREIIQNPAHIFVRHPGVTTLHRSFGYTTQPEQQEPLALVAKSSQSRETESNAEHLNSDPQNDKPTKIPKISIEAPLEDDNDGDTGKDAYSSSQARPQQRNYKNMTRERRIEANARERTRVHTISAAYETLRRAVPAYASSQKLSKLSVLRVACSYILTLSRMTGQDYSSDQSEPSIADCIEAITSTIQTEGKIKRKKDE
ncbi:T-cell acute lymphocytic leukemia protein 1 homolog [Drosophila innubila]|uniref:T-cell acute lymphocytic leukemia protein 1 homolog n=1 Tax=Drosophila innubila TaxID=198719 RepID=UPI00148B403B|nr:T-cell acute lymphocytic leukemia protein 1 homolog [Drosophila innubila]